MSPEQREWLAFNYLDTPTIPVGLTASDYRRNRVVRKTRRERLQSWLRRSER